MDETDDFFDTPEREVISDCLIVPSRCFLAIDFTTRLEWLIQIIL